MCLRSKSDDLHLRYRIYYIFRGSQSYFLLTLYNILNMVYIYVDRRMTEKRLPHFLLYNFKPHFSLLYNFFFLKRKIKRNLYTNNVFIIRLSCYSFQSRVVCGTLNIEMLHPFPPYISIYICITTHMKSIIIGTILCEI